MSSWPPAYSSSHSLPQPLSLSQLPIKTILGCVPIYAFLELAPSSLHYLLNYVVNVPRVGEQPNPFISIPDEYTLPSALNPEAFPLLLFGKSYYLWLFWSGHFLLLRSPFLCSAGSFLTEGSFGAASLDLNSPFRLRCPSVKGGLWHWSTCFSQQ